MATGDAGTEAAASTQAARTGWPIRRRGLA
jgi:hypothetical protein